MNPTEELQNAVETFRHFVWEQPDQALVAKAWGTREVLAHLVYWMESYVHQVEALLDGKQPRPPQGQFDDLNAGAIAADKDTPIAELLRRHQEACTWLCHVTQQHDPDSIVFVLKVGSVRRRPLTWYLIAESGHIRQHQKMLIRQSERAYLKEIDRLQKTVSAFCDFIQELPEPARAAQTWGPKEVLAHLVFWHERYLAQIEAQVAQKAFDAPQGRLKDLNALAVATHHGRSVTELVSRFQRTDEQLGHYGRSLDPQNIILDVQSHRHTLDGALSRIEVHIRNHHRKLTQELPKSKAHHHE